MIKTRGILSIFLGGVSAVVGLVVYASLTTPHLDSFENVKASYQSSELILLDQQGELLHQWRQSKNERTFSWVLVGQVSPAFTQALIKSEDQKFYRHQGVDHKALLASFYQRLFKRSPRGASTLTMQTVKLISRDPGAFQGWIGKLRQIIAAYRLEASWNKAQILESYINLISFRGEIRGLASASWLLFQKSPSGLTLPESTLLSVLIRSPNAPVSMWLKRACWQEPTKCAELSAIVQQLPAQNRRLSENQYAIHLAQRLSKTGVIGEVTTSLHKDIQLYAQEVVQAQIHSLEQKNVRDAAVLVLENATGEVWAYVGGSGLQEKSLYVDGTQALRQAGSTLKPFLYATAFEKNLLHGDSWIEDSAVDIVFDSGIYKPQNHDHHFYGWVQVKTALASSLNVPAVKTFKLLNDNSLWDKLSSMNFRSLQQPEHYGPAMALGVVDVTLEDLTQAFRTLARGGIYSSMTFFPTKNGSSENRQVFSLQSSNEVAKILSENQNRALGFGLDSALSVPGAAVKTGTSKDMRDNWCLGFNSRFTVGVWVGNFNGEPMWNVLGVTGAAPIWKKIMEKLQESYPAIAEKELPKLVQEMDRRQTPEKYPQAQILYPQNGMILALDPGIPADHQKVPLIVQGGIQKNLRWRIDGKEMVSVRDSYLWTPQEGRHSFDLYEGKSLRQSLQIIVK